MSAQKENNNQPQKQEEDETYSFDPKVLFNALQIQKEIKEEGNKSEKRDKTILVISIWALILGVINLILNIFQL